MMAVRIGLPKRDTIRRMYGRGNGGHRLRQAGGLTACPVSMAMGKSPAGARTAVGNEMQQDSAGLDGT
jgi:hypothetical protein